MRKPQGIVFDRIVVVYIVYSVKNKCVPMLLYSIIVIGVN